MNTDLNDREIKLNSPNDIVTVHRLAFITNKTEQFLTLDKAEAGIKTLEVLNDNDSAEIHYVKVKTTRGEFLKELQGLCK